MDISKTVWGEPAVVSSPPLPPKTDIPDGVIVQNPADLPPVPQPPTPMLLSEFKGLPVRADGDKVFLLKGGRRFWITSAQVYSKLGFKFGDEVKIDQATLNVIPEGEPLRET